MDPNPADPARCFGAVRWCSVVGHYGKFPKIRREGFTLLEVMTVIVIICILAVLGLQSFTYLRGRAELGKCVNNLSNLYAAMSGYLTDQGTWPQIPTEDLEDPAYAQAWINVLSPYKIGRVNWICGEVQRQLGNPDYSDRQTARIDYIPTVFSPTPRAPFQWPTQPWFIERADVHGDGNMIIFTNGQIRSLNQVKKDAVALPAQ